MSKARYLRELVDEFCFQSQPKMAFIVGPRQSGKTTFAKSLIAQRGIGSYWNWDQREFRAIWAKSPNKIIEQLAVNVDKAPILVLDEIHKAKLWKRTLKGIFDTLPQHVDIIVTGSARLDTYKKGSDSLLGRYFQFRLHPFSVTEILGNNPIDPDSFLEFLQDQDCQTDPEAEEVLSGLTKFGGFPEPYFGQSERRANAWRKLRLEQLIRQDLRDLTMLPELGNVEMLLALMPERVGSQFSRSAMREDLEVAHTTVTRWLSYLSALFYHFEIKPYSKSIKRSLKKEGKIFLWDYAEVQDPSARFENLIAQHLLKACDYWTDAGFGKFELRFIRNFEGAEIDFLITKDLKPWLPVEVKVADNTLSPNWKVFLPQLSCKFGLQIVQKPCLPNKDKPRNHDLAGKKVFIRSACSVLQKFV